jgi:hypothetical protein
MQWCLGPWRFAVAEKADQWAVGICTTMPAPLAASVPRVSSSDADKSLHASGVKDSMLHERGVDTLAAGRAASLLARLFCVAEHHGPLAQLVRAHG